MTLIVVDTREAARSAAARFYDRDPEREEELSFGWPEAMQEIGVGKAELYRSNKWKKKRSDHEDYMHAPELEGGVRTVMCEPGFLRNWERPSERIEVVGEMVEFESPMPKHFTYLGRLLGVRLQLYCREKGQICIPKGDKGFMEVRIPRAHLGAAEHPVTKETLLFAYTTEGVHMILTGPDLSIQKDGITG